MDDWRVRLAFPVFQLIDYLLSRQRIARFLFDNFRTKDNLKKVLQVRVRCLFRLANMASCKPAENWTIIGLRL